MTLETLLSSRITHVNQDGNREFINLFVYIFTIKAALPPALIYKGDSEIL